MIQLIQSILHQNPNKGYDSLLHKWPFLDLDLYFIWWVLLNFLPSCLDCHFILCLSCHLQGIDEENMEVNEGCEGVGEDECLMRRTLAAHIDYIYTQNKKNP